MAYTAIEPNRTRMVRVLRHVVPSGTTAVSETVVGIAAFVLGVPLLVHLALAVIVDAVLHAARRHRSRLT